MLKHKPWEIAAQMSQDLGTEVIAASDGLKFSFSMAYRS
jgi:hypothetical protein